MRALVHSLTGPVLITGASGQLGDALMKLCMARDIAFFAASRPNFDFERPATIDEAFFRDRPSLVINAAAYTAVDAAEQNQGAAKAGNHTGPLRLAQLCEAAGIPFIHVSTDYVFDGAKGEPYLETDPTGPTGVYGATKRDGEEAIMATQAKAIILRTAWVYAAHGKNFARTMLNAARKTSQLRVVADQRGTPTAAPDLAAAILDIAGIIQKTGWRDSYRGIYHCTNAGATTWHGFATEIFEIAAPLGLPTPTVTPIATADWPTPAKRPADSRLNCGKLAATFGCVLPDWQVSAVPIVRALYAMDAPA
jgi:dTDP-4-dehydrorhamnose reductase